MPDVFEKTVFNGDTIEISFLFKYGPSEPAAVPVSVAGDIWVMTILTATRQLVYTTSSVPTGTNPPIELDKAGEIGRVYVNIPYQLNNFPVGRHYIEFERTVGSVRKTVLRGKFIVNDDLQT